MYVFLLHIFIKDQKNEKKSQHTLYIIRKIEINYRAFVSIININNCRVSEYEQCLP